MLVSQNYLSLNNMSKHPGIILKNHIDKHNVTPEQFADNIGANPAYILAIIAGRSWIDAELAYKLSATFNNTTMKYWLDLQTKYDIGIIEKQMKGWNPKTVYLPDIIL